MVELKRPFDEMPKDLMGPSIFIESTQGSIWYQPIKGGAYRIAKGAIRPMFDQYGERIRLFAHAIDPSGQFWATHGYDGRLCRIDVKDDSLDFTYYYLHEVSITGFENTSLVITDSHALLGGRHGLFKYEIDKLSSVANPSKTLIKEVRINYEPQEIKGFYDLSYDENFINIEFDGISFRRMPLNYSYQMVGIDTVWQESKYKNVQYTNLDPGEYYFKLRLKTRDTDWSEPKVIRFFIHSPYWETWWFRLSAIVLFIVIILFIIRLRVRYIQRKEADKQKIAQELSHLELKALKAQMNPHFIFNVLKSIQSKTLKGEKWETNALLVRFSALIRSSLEYSRADFIPLHKEIDFLNNYLEIEKQRFGNRFDFNIQDDIQDDSVLLPPLIIQPLCENAILHAFNNTNGQLNISFKPNTDNTITVEVTDNGIGFFDQEQSEDGLGLTIIRSRLDLFKKEGYATELQIDFLDNQEKKGSKITLILPCK